MDTWQRISEDLVVGEFVDHQITTFRQEFGWLAELADFRMSDAPVLAPFGRDVALCVTVSAPEDFRMRAILAHFLPNEPMWMWQLYEDDLWHRLNVCTQVVLPLLPSQGCRIEIRSPAEVAGFVQGLHAIGAICHYRAENEDDPELRPEYVWATEWFFGLADNLSAVASEPALPG